MTESCKHHWLCEQPQGRVVAATCKRCGATREFDAWVDYPSKPTAIGWLPKSPFTKKGIMRKLAIEKYVDREFGKLRIDDL